jgi:hypothetical protein
MSKISLALRGLIGLLMVDSIIELGLVSSMVGWLHQTASNGFKFTYNGSTYPIAGTPSDFLVNQGHTSNGAAGTAFVLIGLGGFLSLWLRGKHHPHERSSSRIIYYVWIALQIPALLLTTGAGGYVFAVTNAHRGQTIDTALAAGLDGSPYPVDSWTPQNWFPAVLQLDSVTGRDDIQRHLDLMKGWQYNLIPLFIIHLLETVLALMDFSAWRKEGMIKGHSRI